MLLRMNIIEESEKMLRYNRRDAKMQRNKLYFIISLHLCVFAVKLGIVNFYKILETVCNSEDAKIERSAGLKTHFKQSQ